MCVDGYCLLFYVCVVYLRARECGVKGGRNTYLGERLELDELPELSGMRLESASTSLKDKKKYVS